MSEQFHSAKSRASLNYFTPDPLDNTLVSYKNELQGFIDKNTESQKKIQDFIKRHKGIKGRNLRPTLKTYRNVVALGNKLRREHNKTVRMIQKSERGDFLKGGTKRRRRRR